MIDSLRLSGGTGGCGTNTGVRNPIARGTDAQLDHAVSCRRSIKCAFRANGPLALGFFHVRTLPVPLAVAVRPSWGGQGENRQTDAPQGTGQLPANDPSGWLNIEAQGFAEANIDVPARVVEPNPSLSPSVGKGGFRVEKQQPRGEARQ